MVADTGSARSFAQLLNHLFATMAKPDGGEYSNEDVSSMLREQGEQISASYLWQLRTSKKDNPTRRHMKALAQFFGVPGGYFLEDAVTDRVDKQLNELRQERQRLAEIADRDDVKLMALRAGELAPSRLRLMKELLDVVYREQQAEQGAVKK